MRLDIVLKPFINAFEVLRTYVNIILG